MQLTLAEVRKMIREALEGESSLPPEVQVLSDQLLSSGQEVPPVNSPAWVFLMAELSQMATGDVQSLASQIWSSMPTLRLSGVTMLLLEIAKSEISYWSGVYQTDPDDDEEDEELSDYDYFLGESIEFLERVLATPDNLSSLKDIASEWSNTHDDLIRYFTERTDSGARDNIISALNKYVKCIEGNCDVSSLVKSALNSIKGLRFADAKHKMLFNALLVQV